MSDPAITAFLEERKELWLKKRISINTTDIENQELQNEANLKFSLPVWVPDAANRAKQLYASTHPGKFTHPDAKISPVIAVCPTRADGFLKSGNVAVELDVFGNAAALDVNSFLFIKLSDNQTIIEHLEQSTPIIQKLFDFPTVSFDLIQQGFLAVKNPEVKTLKTSDKIKQVYFPVNKEQYHLLSILTPSGLMFKLKSRINLLRFSETTKAAREAKRNQMYFEGGFKEIYNLTMIGFGGTKPQNISVLNSQNYGSTYLLSSTPPELKERKVNPPKNNFFGSYLGTKSYTKEFEKLHKVLISQDNNFHLREKRDWLTKQIVHQVADQVWRIRSLDQGWSDSDNYNQLPQYQKIWLDQLYSDEREHIADYLPKVKEELAIWFIKTYKSILAEESLGLGDDELSYLIDQCEEALR